MVRAEGTRGDSRLYVISILTAMCLIIANECLGVFNALQGCDGEIEMSPGLTEAAMGPVR